MAPVHLPFRGNHLSPLRSGCCCSELRSGFAGCCDSELVRRDVIDLNISLISVSVASKRSLGGVVDGVGLDGIDVCGLAVAVSVMSGGSVGAMVGD